MPCHLHSRTMGDSCCDVADIVLSLQEIPWSFLQKFFSLSLTKYISLSLTEFYFILYNAN